MPGKAAAKKKPAAKVAAPKTKPKKAAPVGVPANTNGRPSEPAAEWFDVDLLVPWARNPRTYSDVNDVVASISEFGFARPIVAQKKTREIIAGHRSWEAAKQLKMRHVPVRFMDLTERQAHLLALADNRLSERTPWNESELHAILSGCSLEEAALAGWSEKDIDSMSKALAGDEPPDDFDEYDDDINTEHKCPKCGYEWSGKSG